MSLRAAYCARLLIRATKRRPGGYGFDVWTAAKGLTRGYPYRRIEDAYYARRAEIRASAQGRVPAAMGRAGLRAAQQVDKYVPRAATQPPATAAVIQGGHLGPSFLSTLAGSSFSRISPLLIFH
jgi:hypothetical protein